VSTSVSEAATAPIQFPRLQRNPPLADTIAQILLQVILSRRMRPGDEIPSERALSGQFGVSRTVVREALRSLAARGVIEMRPSASPVVAHVSPDVVSDSMRLFLHSTSDTTYAQVYEVRLLFEPELAALAAERATGEDVARLRETCDRLVRAAHSVMKAPTRRDDALLRECATADLEFHAQVARAAHNVIYVILLDAIHDVELAMIAMTMGEPGDIELIEPEHGAILDAIASRDAPRARQAMRSHLSLTDLPDRWASSVGASIP
jgi:GntR family transcriptional regulator, transcriptional repressor for pyruvate dehydrogenase complex